MPSSFKIRNGERKWILKRATADLLPPGILERRKRGFSLPIRDWLRGDLGSTRVRFSSATGAAKRGLLRTPVVERLLDLHARGQRDFSPADLVPPLPRALVPGLSGRAVSRRLASGSW